jgi:hypothetical protein
MAKTPSVNLKDLISRQRELAAAGDANAVKQLARLEKLASESQAPMVVVQDAPTGQPSSKTAESLDKIARKGLLDKTGDGLNANVVKLTDAIRKSMKGERQGTGPEQSTSRAIAGYTPTVREGLQDRVKQMSEKAGGQYNASLKEGLQEKFSQFKKLGSLEGWFDMSEGKNKGLVGQAVRRKMGENQYVKDQKEVNPQVRNMKQYKDLTDEEYEAKRAADLRKQYNRAQVTARAQRDNENRISELTASGYEESDLSRTGLITKREDLNTQQLKDNPALRAENKRLLADIEEATPTAVASKPKKASSPKKSESTEANPISAVADSLTASAAGSSEQSAENLRMMADQNQILKQVEENTRGLAGLSGPSKVSKNPSSQESGEGGGGILGSIADMFGGKGGGLLKKGGALLGRAGSGIMTAGRAVASAASPLLSQAGGLAGRAIAGAGGLGGIAAAAAPIAAVYGAANVVDYGLGKLGVGKDAEGNDLQVDKEQDDANWKKMSWSEKLQSGVARGIEKVGGFVGLGNVSQEAAAQRVKNETEYFAKKEAPNTIPAENDTIKAMQAERDAFAKRGPVSDSAQSQKAYEKVLAAKDKAIESEKQKVGSSPTDVPSKATPVSTGDQRTPAMLARSAQTAKENVGVLSNTANFEREATKLGLDPNNATGIYEGGQLTSITDKTTGKSYPIAVDPSKQSSVDAARSMRAANDNSAKLTTAAAAPEPRAADSVYTQSSENAAATQQGASQAPVVINAPTTNSVQQTQNYAPKSPPRNTESSLQQYNRAKYAF